jgi:uncharacterized protein (DUF305 family)
MSHQSCTMTPALVAALGVALLAIAGEQAAAQHDPQHARPAGAVMEPADQAYRAAMERMHRAMAIDLTGDPDADFARAMIPHHQGASTWRAWSWNTAAMRRFEDWHRR